MADQESHSSFQDTVAKSAELGRHARELGRDTRETNLSFLRTEIATGLTFAKVAMDSKDDSAKRVRNEANARKAYDTIVNWMAHYSGSEALHIDIEELEPGLTELREALAELGEAL